MNTHSEQYDVTNRRTLDISTTYLVTAATVSVATGHGEIVFGKGAGARSYGRDDTLFE